MPADLAWIVPGALGALGLAAVACGRLFGRWRFRRRLRTRRRRLASFDPAARALGAVAVLDLGLTRRTAGVLLDHVSDEDDERVRLAIAQTVVSRGGEASRRRRVRRLEAWAAAEVAAQGRDARRRPDREREEREDAEKQQKKEPPPISWRASASQS